MLGVLDEALELRLDKLVSQVQEGVLDLRTIKNDEQLWLLRLLVLNIIHNFS